ncbi:CopD family protein [Pontixanthobacter aestiaquae]|uniref:Protoporphyrinogen IX oxidase n=1 Tax=Pontixanthobacter aestiaquae TaxID=1509367 RepID=A0A844Z340_9SPHN|nr:CopD family protein [Pontixanthobacter aestiaquae]MDN3646890.1 CopD family protein [Pontixanthobacter aestiaquae]MXO82128.1 CopD family protein [Pontixanthobacter aestiaquae]
MQEILIPIYEWLKAGHIIFVIFWMAGLFMLPRFFVYHQEDGPPGSEMDSVWIDRERKLLKIILAPSLIVVWVLGLALMSATAAHTQTWFHIKFLVVLLLSGYHGYMAGYAKKLARGVRPLEGKKLRLLNEVPGISAALIVVLVIVGKLYLP